MKELGKQLKGGKDFNLGHMKFEKSMEYLSIDSPQAFADTGWKLKRLSWWETRIQKSTMDGKCLKG